MGRGISLARFCATYSCNLLPCAKKKKQIIIIIHTLCMQMAVGPQGHFNKMLPIAQTSP